MWKLIAFLTSFICTVVSGQFACVIDLDKRQKCGITSISSYKCEQANCCYDESRKECYFSTQSAPKYSEWSNWTECSASCGGGGTKKRERSCLYASGTLAPQGLCLIGSSIESQMCNTHKCGEEKTEIVCEEDDTFCGGKKNQCGGSEYLRKKCPITCGFCKKDIVDEDCKDISATCSQAPELCTRGFLSAQFRKWCKKTCGLCGESSDKPVLLTTVAPDKQVTAIISTTEYTPKYPLGQCIDEFKTCARVEGWCDEMKHRREMTLYCRRTCNLCFTVPRPTEFSKYVSTISSPVILTTTKKVAIPTIKSTLASTLKSSSAPNVFSLAATQKAATPDSSSQCFNKLNDVTCSRWKKICRYSATARKGCRKSCGLCTGDGTTNTLITTAVLSTLKTTTKPTTLKMTTLIPTTQKIVTTSKTTTIQSTKKAVVTLLTLECKDRYKYCADLIDHCNTRTYLKIMSKHCRYTCNINNCREQ